MEEIIIDGVNVAGCVRLQDDKISCNLGGECKGWENCYYKQLKRLEQENARLKEEIEIRDNLSEKFRKEALSWANIANEYQKDKTKLEQTLQEIKAIAKRAFAVCDDDCGNANKFKEIIELTKAEEE